MYKMSIFRIQNNGNNELESRNANVPIYPRIKGIKWGNFLVAKVLDEIENSDGSFKIKSTEPKCLKMVKEPAKDGGEWR